MGKHRQIVLETARALIHEKGLFEFSMRDLAKATDLSIGTLYREVRNKDDLLLLIFSDNIRLYGQGLRAAKTLDLNGAEHLLFLTCFAPYSADFTDNDLGTNFLASNFGLVRRATPAALDEVRSHFMQYRQQVNELVGELLDNGVIQNRREDALQVIVDLNVLSRGTHVLRTSFINPAQFNTVDKLCQLGQLVLGQLDWNIEGPLIDDKKLKLAWKTAMDQNFLIPVPRKTKR